MQIGTCFMESDMIKVGQNEYSMYNVLLFHVNVPCIRAVQRNLQSPGKDKVNTVKLSKVDTGAYGYKRRKNTTSNLASRSFSSASQALQFLPKGKF